MVNSVKKIICPVCGSEKVEPILTANDYLVSNENFDILHCSNCTLRITSPKPNINELSKYYNSEEYISHKKEGQSFINKIYKIVQRMSLVKKRRLIEKYFGDEKGSLLDIGCGTGDFIKVMQKAGWQISGVEPDENARRIAKELSGIQIYSTEEHFYDTIKYDIITMWHSLEHIHDLNEQISKIDELLNSDGMLYIAVPNYTSFDARYYKQNWAAYDVPRHLYHFSPVAMQKLFEKYEYSIIGYKQLPFDPFYISLLSELSVIKSKNIIRAFWIGLRSYLNGLINSKRSSSVLYIFKRKG